MINKEGRGRAREDKEVRRRSKNVKDGRGRKRKDEERHKITKKDETW